MKKRVGSLLLCLSILASMAGLAGVLPTAAEIVVTQLNTENADRAIAAKDNLLTTAAHTGYNATGETETYIASSNWTKMLDGQVIGVNTADSNDAKAAIGGKWADGYQKQFLVFQLTETYAIDRLMLGGTSDADYSIKGASVYIGNQSLTQVLAEGTAPVWTSDGAIVNGVLVELGERIKGQFVIFELTCRANSSYGQCWISELAVAGSSLITTEVLGADDADKLIAPEDNLLSKAVFRATDKTGTTDAPTQNNVNRLFDGQVAGINGTGDTTAIISGERWADGQPFSQMYLSFTLGSGYQFEQLLLGGIDYDGWGFINPQVYIGNESIEEIIANGTAPVWSYTGCVLKAVLVDLSLMELTGTTVVIRSDTKGSGQWTYVQASEAAITGTPLTVATELGTEDSNRVIAPADNILPKAAAKVTDKTGTVEPPVKNNWDKLFDGQVAGVTGTLADADKTIISGDRWADGQPFSRMYFSFTFSEEYRFTSLLLGGVDDPEFGFINPQVYIGNESIAEIIANGTAPMWSYAGVVQKGILLDLSREEWKGTTIVIASDTKGSGSWTYVQASELAATGAPTTVKTRQETIVCVGDSITYGTVFPNKDNWSPRQLENPYPVQLERLLNAASTTVEYTVVNAGISGSAVIGASEGYSTSNSSGGPTHWLTEQASEGFVRSADKVLIMLGTNDAHSSCWSGRAADYKTYYQKIIAAFREKNPNVQIYILTSPYTNVATHADGLENGVVPQQKELSRELGLPLIDVYGATKQFVADNGGDLSCFIDAVDIAKGLCVHPHEAGAGVIARTVLEGLTLPVRSLGAQLRSGYSETAATADLRFCFELDARQLTADALYNTQISADTAVTVGDSEYHLVRMGALVARGDKVSQEEMTLEQVASQVALKDVPAQKLYSTGEYMALFTAVVVDVPARHFDTQLAARPYAIYEKDGVECVVYGGVITRSVHDVAALVG